MPKLQKMGLLFNSIIYTTSLVGILTLLPIDDNVTFTKYSVTPQNPLTGPFSLNEKLSGIHKVFENQFKGPEAILYHNNTLYTSVHLGHVLKIVDNQIIPIVKFGKVCDGFHEEHICGRPLGLSMDKNGFLYVADAYYGIFKVDMKSKNQYGTMQQLVSMENEIDGFRPKIPNSVIVASDGAVYWTDSDRNFALFDGLYTVFTDATGRLLKYDQKTKMNTVLVKNIHFANGLEMSDDESFLIISETGRYRVLKYYLKGPNAGNTEVFVDGLPGMPDNVKKIGKFFYFPLVIQRLPVLESIGEYPIIRMMIYKFLRTIDITFQAVDLYFPNIYSKKAMHWMGHYESTLFLKLITVPRLSIIKVNENGVVVSSFHSTDGLVSNICDFELVDDKLYFGSPFNSFLGIRNVPHGFL